MLGVEVEVVCRRRGRRWMSKSGDGVGRVDGERVRVYRRQGVEGSAMMAAGGATALLESWRCR